MSLAIRELLSREEMAALTRKSDLRGAWAILQVWLVVGACFTLLAWYPNPVTFVLAVVVLGGQQLACAVVHLGKLGADAGLQREPAQQ